MAKNLVIVESPAKSKTIKKFLWPDYEVKASYGHIIDLPKKGIGIDFKKDFEPTYEITPEKKKVVAELKKFAKEADKVRIATDEDREGEAIGRHVCTALKLDVSKTARIVFHEITKNAITKAIENPRTIDMNLVDAQQARRILDRVVGFQVSPILWDKVKRGLSAGRVQSVAVKLIVEKEREIQNFKPEESRKLNALLPYQKDELNLELHSIDGKKSDLTSQDAVAEYYKKLGLNAADAKPLKKVAKKAAKGAKTTVEEVAVSGDSDDDSTTKDAKYLVTALATNLPFTLGDAVAKDTKSSPSAPFTTSTLQQTASRILGRGVKQVMQVAQKLYENGHITYMRTDSTNLSQEARDAAKNYIVSNFGANYHSDRTFATKSANAQEAHEAIRPTHPENGPQSVAGTAQEKSLYALVRERTIASQMADARGKSLTYIFYPLERKQDQWHCKGDVMTFDGWTKIGGRLTKKNEDVILPEIPLQTTINAKEIIANQQFSSPPPRYTEASLVKALESNGIGRPSTYAPTISTVQDRWYVVKGEDKKLHPSEIAFVVTDFLEKHFADMMSYKFTAGMEEKLDHVAEWEVKRQAMMHEFYDGFKKELDKAGHSEREISYTGGICPKDGGRLVYKFGKMGKFISCENYPTCDFIENLPEENAEMAALQKRFEGRPCPEGGTIVIKRGRFGYFLASSEYPKVKRISSIPDPIQEILQEKLGQKKYELCQGGNLIVKKYSKFGKVNYFLACDNYPTVKHTENISAEAMAEAQAILDEQSAKAQEKADKDHPEEH